MPGPILLGGGSSGSSSGATSLNDLTDVTISALADGEVLVYNSTSGVWENAAAAASTLGALTDVDVTGAAVGDGLIFNGTDWEIGIPGFVYKHITSADSPYTATANEYILADSSGGAITINLPNAAALGTATEAVVRVRDQGQQAATNNITIDPVDKNLFGIADTAIIDENGAEGVFVYDSATGQDWTY